MIRGRLVLASILLACLLPLAGTAAPNAVDPVLWPERQRAFFQDGPGWLLSAAERIRFAAADEAGRDAMMAAFLAEDPDPATEGNELAEAIARRQALVASEFLSPLDVRARLLFLDGPPVERHVVECGVTFQPIEIWSYPASQTPVRLVLYRPGPTLPFELWLPTHSKAALYTEEMAFWLERWERFGGLRPRRFDLQACPDAKLVDEATGIDGLHGYREGRRRDADLARFLAPPSDLASWAREAAATPVPAPSPRLEVGTPQVSFPARDGQRIVARLRFDVPPGAGLQPVSEGEEKGLKIAVDGVTEQDGAIFEEFRVLFKPPAPAPGEPLALEIERPLRPERSFLVRLRIHDEGSGRQAVVRAGFRVPAEPRPEPEVPVPPQEMAALEGQIATQRIPGKDSLILTPPSTEVVLGLWRAEALVTGERIRKVTFSVDGEPQLTRNAPPYTAEVRLAEYPTEQVVRAVGYDANGEEVAADEVVVNEPRGKLAVRIVEPKRGVVAQGEVTARAEIVVPQDRRLASVEFQIDDRVVAHLQKPPWEARIAVPAGGEMTYLTVVAVLDDGSRAEDMRFLNAPRFLEQVDVDLVELYTTVLDAAGAPVTGLAASDFQVLEDGRPQKIERFEIVKNLPLTVGITLDTSGSMATRLPVAEQAAVDFLHEVLDPGDRAFAVAFAGQPALLIPPTDDLEAVASALRSGLVSVGDTALHDAIVTSLYYFRGFHGQRALVVLSDGDDNASQIPFRDALEYARRSGVTIYTVGIDVSVLGLGIRSKLENLAKETGGRSFFIGDAGELAGVYRQIEDELRTQYLLAYSPDRPPKPGTFRQVEVKLAKRGLKARTIRGYYP